MPNLFGDFLRRIRKDRNMTLTNVQTQTNISNGYISQIERGARGVPSIIVLKKLSRCYGVPISLFLDKADKLLSEKKVSMSVPKPDLDFTCGECGSLTFPKTSREYSNLTDKEKEIFKVFILAMNNKKHGKKTGEKR